MDANFWQQKWAANEIGFHLPDVHPLVQKYAGTVFSGVRQILVPLCGKSHDLRFLADCGYMVVGNELSELAVQQFWQEQQIRNEKIVSGDLSCYRSLDAERDLYLYLWQGDFFALSTGHVGQCQGVYDRAALVALPQKMRARYVSHLQSLLPQAQMLLITLDYAQQEMDGPPFSVPPDEVHQLFDGCEIKQLRRVDIIDHEPKFKARGVSAFYESAYHIRW